MYNIFVEKYTEKEIKIIFKNLCCSKCRNDFTLESITVKEREGDILICNLKCQVCEMDFGDVVFNYHRKANSHLPMEIIDGPPPITSDDVINAHRFIKGM